MRLLPIVYAGVYAGLALAACNGTKVPAIDGATPSDGGAADGAAGDGAMNACPRLPQAADRVRRVIVTHPFDANGAKDTRLEVLDLSAAGVLTKTGKIFNLGNFFDGTITFTPDGQLGFQPQDDGSIGEFRLASDGTPTVLQAAYKGPYHADKLVMDPSGERLYVLDSEWRENNGGIYALRIGCDGALTEEGKWAAAKLPYAMVLVPNDPTRAVVSAVDILASTGSADSYLLGWGMTPQLVGQASGFGSADATISAAAATSDSKFVLFADNGMFSATKDSVSVLQVQPSGLKALTRLSPLKGPTALVTSPFGNAALVVLTNTEDAIVALGYDVANTTTPFTIKGQLAYKGKKPSLPGGAVLIDRGALKGQVLVAEVNGVRQVAFGADGSVTDLGLFAVGMPNDVAASVGAIGVQP